jgi:hypothetical protein
MLFSADYQQAPIHVCTDYWVILRPQVSQTNSLVLPLPTNSAPETPLEDLRHLELLMRPA